MSEQIDLNEEPECPALENDGIGLARDIRRRLRACADRSKAAAGEVTYLWIHLEAGRDGWGKHPKPALDAWINTIDEAAALGVRNLVISAQPDFASHPEVWVICEWAQSVHEMMVGLHTDAQTFTSDELDMLRALDSALTRVLISSRNHAARRILIGAGLSVHESNPPYGALEVLPCRRACNMLFINAHGDLYPCGMSNGDERFHMGNIHEVCFHDLLDNRKRLGAVDHLHAENGRACEGCPPLVAGCFQ